MGEKVHGNKSKEKMEKVLVHLKEELNTIRTGAANASMLDRVMVDYYGSPTPLNQIAGISVQEGRSLLPDSHQCQPALR